MPQVCCSSKVFLVRSLDVGKNDKTNPLCVKFLIVQILVRDCWAAHVPVNWLGEINRLTEWWLSYPPGIATDLEEL